MRIDFVQPSHFTVGYYFCQRCVHTSATNWNPCLNRSKGSKLNTSEYIFSFERYERFEQFERFERFERLERFECAMNECLQIYYIT